ncbi:hypothetical protein ACVWXB_004675 [Streptomyces sp. TE12347]
MTRVLRVLRVLRVMRVVQVLRVVEQPGPLVSNAGTER